MGSTAMRGEVALLVRAGDYLRIEERDLEAGGLN